MLGDLKGKRALVTGSSTGIGAAVAKAYAALGMRVVVHGFHNKDAANAVAGEIRSAGGEAHVVLGDVSKAEAARDVVMEAVAALGGLDVLVNNAGGILDRVTNEGYSDEQFERVYSLNVKSVFNVTRAAYPHLSAAGGGSIINTGSVAGHFGGFGGSAIYASAKAAVHNVTRNAAREFAEQNIRVNTVAPGFIITPFHANTPEAVREQARAQIPLKRLGTAEDCAGAYVFLASDNMSGYVTGQIVDVNGGQYMA